MILDCEQSLFFLRFFEVVPARETRYRVLSLSLDGLRKKRDCVLKNCTLILYPSNMSAIRIKAPNLILMIL